MTEETPYTLTSTNNRELKARTKLKTDDPEYLLRATAPYELEGMRRQLYYMDFPGPLIEGFKSFFVHFVEPTGNAGDDEIDELWGCYDNPYAEAYDDHKSMLLYLSEERMEAFRRRQKERAGPAK